MNLKQLNQQKRINQIMIRTLENISREAKIAKAHWYELSTPDTPEGQAAFWNYTGARKMLASAKRELKILRDNQKAVKQDICKIILTDRIFRELDSGSFFQMEDCDSWD